MENKKRKGTIRHEEFKAQQAALYKKKLRKVKIEFLKSARKRVIPVKAHKRYDPRINKKVDVSSYQRNQKFTPYKNSGRSNVLPAKRLTTDNIGYIEYKILELIKLNAHYNTKTTMDDLYDELSFGTEDEKHIKEMVQNLQGKGLLNKDLNPTNEGKRIFWEWYQKNDEENEDVEALKDNPNKLRLDLKKEGFDIIGTTEYPNDTMLYLKELDKEADRINKDLKENIKFKKSQEKGYDHLKTPINFNYFFDTLEQRNQTKNNRHVLEKIVEKYLAKDISFDFTHPSVNLNDHLSEEQLEEISKMYYYAN